MFCSDIAPQYLSSGYCAFHAKEQFHWEVVSTAAFLAVNPSGVGRCAALTASAPVLWAGEVADGASATYVQLADNTHRTAGVF